MVRASAARIALFGLLFVTGATSAAAMVWVDSGSTRAASGCAGEAGSILGTRRAEAIVGTQGDDVIVGRGGADVIRGLGGNDIVCGGRGADRLKGGTGNDVLRGNRGDDVARGGDGLDICVAESMFSCNEPVPTPTPTPTVTPTPTPTATPTPTPTPTPTEPSGPTNFAPTDISLTNASVPEAEPAGTVVGTLSASDPDVGQTHTFSLVAGAGDTDNASFTIVGNELRTAAEFDFEVKSSYSVRIRATDNGSPSGFFDEAFVVTVTGVNDAPVVTTSAGASPYTEGDPATVIDGSLTVADQDDTNLEGAAVVISSGFEAGDELVFSDQNGITGNFSAGTLTLSGTASIANYQTALRSVQFAHTGDNPTTSKTVQFTVDDGDVDSATESKAITITPVNDVPVVDNSAGDTPYTEGAAATVIDSAVTVTDPDSNLTGATVQITGGLEAGDSLTLAAQPVITSSYNGGTGTLTLSGTAPAADYQTALRAVRFANPSNDNPSATRTVTFQASDAGGAGPSDTKGMSVTPVNDAPIVTISGGSTSYTEGDPATAIDTALTVADIDDVNLVGATVVISSGFQAGDELVFSNQGGITGNLVGDTLTLTGTASPATYQTALRSVQFRNTGDNPTSTDRSVRFTVNDGDVDSNSPDRSISVTAVNDAPVADDETFDGTNSAVGNTALVVNDPDDGAPTLSSPKKSITGDILAGDADADGPGPLTVTAATQATTDGGSVTLESDGDFTFHPAASTSCTDTSDSFTYTVNDGVGGSDTGQVTISISGCVWYVSNNASGNSGTSEAPFDTLVQAETASGANHTVFVFDGDNTSTGYATGFAMKAGQRLIGEHEGLVVGSDTLHPSNPGAHPTLTATGEDVVALDDGNEVRGFNLDPEGAGGGIAGASGDTGGGTIDDVNIADAGTAGLQPGLELDTTTGTFNISNLTVSTTGATGVRLNNAGTVNLAPTGTISITTANATGLSTTDTSMGTSTVDTVTVTGSGAGGVLMSNTTGTTTFGGLSLTTTSGGTPAFSVANGGTISVPPAGTANISATGGPAVDVTGTDGAALAFDSVSSANSANDGINLAGLGAGTFSASSGSITGAPGIAFDLDGGSGDVTYPGTLGNGSGSTAEITGRSGGTVTLSGAISDTADAGGGISVTGNTGGSTTFGNASKVLNTTTSPAVTFATSDGHTLSFTGGGLDIDATSGAGINAATSGTLIVSGTSNSITTTSGTALTVTDTDIGASGLTFESVSANGATNGIVLNNTGASAGLTVAGNGSACAAITDNCTGGTIQATTGDAISLTTTQSVSLTRVRVINNLGNGIRGSGVTGFTVADSVIDNNADDAATDEAGLNFTNLAGTASITRTLVSNHLEDNARIVNSSGTLSQLTVTDSIFRDTDVAAPGDDGLQVSASGGSITADVLGSSFLRNRDVGLEVTTSGSGTIDIEVDDSATPSASTFDDNFSGVGILHNSTGTLNFDVLRSTIDGTTVTPGTAGSGSPIRLELGSSATNTMSGIVDNNTLTNSHSTTGPGVGVFSDGVATMTVAIRNNNISQVAHTGILVVALNTSDINATINNNTISLTNSASSNGIQVDSGGLVADTTQVCADIAGNTSSTAGAGFSGILVRQRFASTTFTVEDYAGAPTNDGAVATFLTGGNNASTASASHGGAGFGTTGECPMPT